MKFKRIKQFKKKEEIVPSNKTSNNSGGVILSTQSENVFLDKLPTSRKFSKILENSCTDVNLIIYNRMGISGVNLNNLKDDIFIKRAQSLIKKAYGIMF